jgi:KaiC/GvpD/RAD55 family RecA-like ATPase
MMGNDNPDLLQGAANNQNRLRLGVPFDLLFDRDENELKKNEAAIVKITGVPDAIANYGLKGGLRLPGERSSGTGNIVIRGRPGTAKSILGMQMMYQCCKMNPANLESSGYYSWFIALEDTPEHVLEKAGSFGWDDLFFPIRLLNDMEELSNPDDYAEALRRVLTIGKRTDCSIQQCTLNPKGNKNCERHPHEEMPERRVYLSCLSPRHLMHVENAEFDIFEERYQQLEKLLWAAESLSEERGGEEIKLPKLGMVCIDSLNVFGDHLLTREQLHRLFKLFTKHKVIGVFILEEDEGQVLSPDSRLHEDVIEFLADVIVAMQYGEDAGYFVRYFEIVKSRYQHQVYGKHPFKITRKENQEKNRNINLPVETGVVIFPSLHYVVYGTEKVK